jgi:hypothetical protein
MSLSFVSKTIQTSRDDGGFDEKPVESSVHKNVGESSYNQAQKPLFEQLRANQEKDDEERAEAQRSLMRGSLTLDVDDCAHLDGIQKQLMEKKATQKRETENELAIFRAAQAERLEVQADASDPGRKQPVGNLLREKRSFSIVEAPQIVVKKRRLRQAEQSALLNDDDSKKQDETGPTEGQDVNNGNKSQKYPSDSGCHSNNSLGGLLSGYGSSDDDD